jgi:hypothetical protein
MTFTKFRITTDGEKFRPEGYLVESKQWLPLTAKGYWGCVSYGYVAENGWDVFETKEEALNYIRKEYGEFGIRNLEKEWRPC